MPKVSVVIPCYNQGIYLKEAIKSVYNSSYKNIEIIVINDGSDDTITQSVIEQISNYPDLKVITTENLGVCNARNTGIKAATGKYILPLDADDKIHKLYIEKAVAILENDKNTGIVYCQAETFGTTNKKWNLKPPTKLHEDIINSDLFLNLAPNADDLWVWAMYTLKNTELCLVENNINTLYYTNPAREYGILKGYTLYSSNSQGNNDKQLNNILKHYPQILDIISKRKNL